MDIPQYINHFNEWWESGNVPERLLEPFRRSGFYSATTMLDLLDRELTIVGPRQVGKTTLVYQLIDYLLLEKKIDPKRIFFLLFSDSFLANNQENIEKCIQNYEENVLEGLIKEEKEPVYFFFDEVQYLEKWELFIKTFVDLKLPVRFILTGSAGFKILQKSKESLAGRVYSLRLDPFLFKEYLKFHKKDIISPRDIYRDLKHYKSFKSFYKRLRSFYNKNLSSKSRGLDLALKKYFQKGGFPKSYQIADETLFYRYLNQDVLERVTAMDIPQVADVRDIKLLQSLIVIGADWTSQIISYTSLAQEFGARHETISTYLSYLESAYLLYELHKFKKTEMGKLRADKKMFICDLGLRNAVLKLSPQAQNTDKYKGSAAETIAFNHLRSKEENLYFWREGKDEVDFIAKGRNFTLPIEIKFRNKIDKQDLGGILKFIEKFHLGGGIVVTDSLLDFKDNLVFIPLKVFLLFF